VLRHTFHVLGRALAPAVAAFRPEVLVVGGSMSASWDLIERPLAAGLAQRGITRLRMRPGRHRIDAPLIGAAQQALQKKTEVGP
jgi:glucokinase